jgi:actin-like ATPase involved in cell morphogenesis
MKFGLDLGTMNIVSAYKEGEKWVFRRDRNVFLELPENAADVSEFMADAGNKLITIGSKKYVIGEEAVNYATFLGQEFKRPFKTGLINPDEDETAITILDIIIKSLLKHNKSTDEQDSVVFCIPGNPVTSNRSVTYHEKTLQWLVEKTGVKAKSINEALAIIYAELGNTLHSGIGISFGAGMTNVCLAYKGMPIFQFSIENSGDWIDQQVAAATGKPMSDITYIKENSLDLSIDSTDRVQRYLRIYYEELINNVIGNIVKFFKSEKRLPPQLSPTNPKAETLSIAIAGGTSSPKGFADLLKKKIEENKEFPLKIKEIRVPSEPLFTVAKGLCTYAEKRGF